MSRIVSGTARGWIDLPSAEAQVLGKGRLDRRLDVFASAIWGALPAEEMPALERLRYRQPDFADAERL